MMYLWEIVFEDQYGPLVQWFRAESFEEALRLFRNSHSEGVLFRIISTRRVEE